MDTVQAANVSPVGGPGPFIAVCVMAALGFVIWLLVRLHHRRKDRDYERRKQAGHGG